MRKNNIGRISVIIASYLGDYKGAAKQNRQEKFIRALESIISQNYNDIEIVVVSDGCPITMELFIVWKASKKYQSFTPHKTVSFKRIYLKKQKLFSGKIRNEGIKAATGEIICYLDVDDMFGSGHLQRIAEEFQMDSKLQWVYYNDLIRKNKTVIYKRDVKLEHGLVGTSSIAHRKLWRATWKGCNGYGHDWEFIQKLIKYYPNYKQIFGCNYLVCHIPGLIES